MNVHELREVAKAKAVEMPDELQEAIDFIDAIVAWRRANVKTRSQDGAMLQRQLIIFDHIDILQKYQVVEMDRWTSAVNHLVHEEGYSVAGAERLADEAFPLANGLRRRIRSVSKVGEAIRSELSYLKSEHQNLDR